MATTNVTTLREMVFSGTGAFNLVQCTSRSIDPAVSTAINHGGGEPAPSYISTLEARPLISFETTEISRFMTNVNYLTGLAVNSAGSGITALNCYFSHLENFGGRKSGSNHSKIGSITKALVVPKTLSVTQSGEATATADIICCTSDGTTAPWTYAGSQAVAVTNPDVTEKFTLGPVKENTTALDGVVGWTMDYGCGLEILSDGGGYYPYFAAIKTNNPSFVIQTTDTTYMSSIGTPNGRVTSSTFDFYMTKMTNVMTGGVSRVSNASAEHIKIRIPSGKALLTLRASSAGNNAVAPQEIVVTPITSGGTFLIISAASAIT